MSDIDSIIQQLERQKTAIDQALQALRGMSGAAIGTARGTKRTGVSPEGRQRQIEAMRRYWAKKRAGQPAATKKRRGGRGLTEAGRKALSENMRRMWAAKRTASAARKGSKKRAS
jgi:hypothetical protein